MGKRLALLVTGASGMALPRHALGAMARSEQVERVHLVVSRGAIQVLRHELESETSGPEGLVDAAGLSDGERAKVHIHRDNELDAPISSGLQKPSSQIAIATGPLKFSYIWSASMSLGPTPARCQIASPTPA